MDIKSIIRRTEVNNPTINLCGIYMIFCTANNKVYIGQTKRKIAQRFVDHKWALINSKHTNSYLQNIYNKYGPSTILYIALENCRQDQLNEQESYYFNLFDKETLINLGPVGNTAGTVSMETRQKISEAQKGRKRGPLSEKHKEALRNRKNVFKRATLTIPQVLEIKKRLIEGESQISLSRKFNIGRTAIGYIANNKRWRDVGPEIPKTIASKNLPHILSKQGNKRKKINEKNS